MAHDQVSHKDHLVQFYQTEQFLYRSVMRFITEGIKQKEGALIIATKAHSKALELALALKFPEIGTLLKSEQLIFWDADEVLSQILVDGKPDSMRFHSIIGDAIRKLQERFPKVRAYGEMVNLLWSKGNLEATLVLEREWNALLAAETSLSLLCGYCLENFDDPKTAPYLDICKTHAQILPDEKPAPIEGIEYRQEKPLSRQLRAD